jgi:hypothetical protein
MVRRQQLAGLTDVLGALPGWTMGRIRSREAEGVDSIIEWDLAEGFDFGDLRTITVAIEKKASRFTDDIDSFLSHHESKSKG